MQERSRYSNGLNVRREAWAAPQTGEEEEAKTEPQQKGQKEEKDTSACPQCDCCAVINSPSPRLTPSLSPVALLLSEPFYAQAPTETETETGKTKGARGAGAEDASKASPEAGGAKLYRIQSDEEEGNSKQRGAPSASAQEHPCSGLSVAVGGDPGFCKGAHSRPSESKEEKDDCDDQSQKFEAEQKEARDKLKREKDGESAEEKLRRLDGERQKQKPTPRYAKPSAAFLAEINREREKGRTLESKNGRLEPDCDLHVSGRSAVSSVVSSLVRGADEGLCVQPKELGDEAEAAERDAARATSSVLGVEEKKREREKKQGSLWAAVGGALGLWGSSPSPPSPSASAAGSRRGTKEEEKERGKRAGETGSLEGDGRRDPERIPHSKSMPEAPDLKRKQSHKQADLKGETQKRVSLHMTLAEKFPVSLENFSRILEVATSASANGERGGAVGKLREILSFPQVRETVGGSWFPVRVEVPVHPTVRAVVSVEKFEVGAPLSEDLFKVPSNYVRVARKFKRPKENKSGHSFLLGGLSLSTSASSS
uniref:Ankyrin repeat domain-containing protein n=1 Tax=Chromera velia CCMP2878 TaxID=1169474 RepID=A0A0G4H2D6_9ALVE|eukprot:Cvel_24393.t1-p1 / transcript=Cvel_24393.t1 / gene=Cvel_24393 / organism=Chromera_velia_CCMP2878 / gene_product=hypothetical protein / transcript_product=hypothetical protein / location=Cvel_scaffold2630:21135-25665(-) / protein_length=539 / sequence_SO=supercontig / SO=protein_coding / is_pseudo=false